MLNHSSVETLSYILSNLFRIYVIYLFARAYFHDETTVKKIYIIIAFTGYFIINTAGYLIFPETFFNMISNIVPFFLLTFLYNSSVLRKVMAVVISYVSSMCIDVLMVSLEHLLNDRYLIISSGIATSLMIFLAERVFEFFTDKNGNYHDLKKGQLLMIIFVPVGSIIIALQTMTERNFNYIVESAILLTINVIVFYMYDTLLKTSNEKYKLAVLEEQNLSYAGQLKLYEESVHKERIIKHDIKNHMFRIKEYAEEENVNELRKYIESMMESIDVESDISSTGNHEIDSILNFKCSGLKHLGAELHIDLNVPDKINIESFDLTKILGNLLDNVYDAVSQTQKKIVYIRIDYEKGIVNICTKNTYNGSISVKDGEVQTIKPNSEKHGLGLKSIKEAVEKYNGDINIEYDDNVFSVYLILYER